MKSFLYKLLVGLCILLPLSTQLASAVTQNDIDCSLVGGIVGTCAYEPCDSGAQTSDTPSSPISGGVAFDAGMTVDDDGVGPSHGDPNHQGHTSYADGKLNADNTNYIALASTWASKHGLQLGDVAAVQYKGKTAYAVYGDNWQAVDQVHGEGSVHLVEALGGTFNSSLADSGVHYVVFPGSHSQLSGSVEQTTIDQIGAQLGGSNSNGSNGSSTTSGTVSPTAGCCGSSNDNTNTSNTNSGSSTNLTGDQKISGTFLLGFDASTPKQQIEDVFKKYKAGGLFVLGTNDAASAGFNKSFFAQLAQDAGHPIVAASDEEGGQIHRYSYSFNYPSPNSISSMSDSQVQALGKKVGDAMAANGLNTDLAPVLDVSNSSNGSDTGVAGRAFSNKPDEVTAKAGAFAAGLNSANVHPVYKHFPGLGSSSGNTDTSSVTSPSLNQLEAKDLKPYAAIDNKNGAAVMLDNAHVPGLTAGSDVASTSPDVVKLLTGKYNFNGLIMTDDLTAKGVGMSVGTAVANALKAGVDMPLFTYSSGAIDSAVSAAKGVDTSKALQKISDFISGGGSNTNSDSITSCCQTDSTQLTGNTNAEKVWNFFNGKGLNNTSIAAIMGNWQIESGFDPTIVYGGGHSSDPASVSVAWGISQWLPGSKVLGIQKRSGVSGNIADLATQLNVVWWEISTNHSPSAGWNFNQFKAITDVTQATQYWQAHYEGSSGQADQNRVNAAHTWLNRAGGGNLPSSGSANNSSNSSSGTSDGSNCSSSTSTTGLTNPFPKGWTPGRLDMGYDGTFKDQIVAPFSGTITYASKSFSNWGGWIELKADQKIAGLPSSTLYFAEGVKPAAGITADPKKPVHVNAGQPIADAFTTGAQAGIPGNIEWGVAKDGPVGTPTDAFVHGQCGSASAKSAVLDFVKWAEQALHVAPPAQSDHAGCP